MPQPSTTGALLWDHSRGSMRGGCWLRHLLSQKLACAETEDWTAVAERTKASDLLLVVYLERSWPEPAPGPPTDRERCTSGV